MLENGFSFVVEAFLIVELVIPRKYFLLGEQRIEEALLTSYCNPPDMSGLDQACQEMRDQVRIKKPSLIGNLRGCSVKVVFHHHFDIMILIYV